MTQKKSPRQGKKQSAELGTETEVMNLNVVLLDSLPHPAMYIRRKDRVVLAANQIALEMGVKVGGHCWRDFTKAQYLSQKNKKIAEKYPDLVPAEFGVKCAFCLGDECILVSPKQNDPEVRIFNSIWDIHWIKVADDIYLHYALDITESKRSERALRESKLTAERYLNIAAEIIVALDSEGSITHLNESGHQLLGYKKGLIGKNWFDTCIPAEERDELRRFFGMLKNGEIQSMDARESSVVTSSGEKKAILWHHTTLRDVDGRFTGTLSSGEDITERMEMEKALRVALAKYKTLFESFPLGVTIADEAGNILETNPAAEKILAIPRNGQNQRRIDGPEWQIIRPDGTPMPADEFASTRALKEKRKVENAEMGIIRPDQTIAWISVTAAPLPTESHGVVITYDDITERKRAENAVEAANIELQAALARERQLAHTDMLTGVNNRRSLYELATHALEIATRYRQPLSLILFDLDHFKKVNDTFGHTVGDQILVQVTQAACAELRSADAIGRYGGEEFVVLLPMTNAQRAFSLAERIRESVAKIRVPTPVGAAAVTISIGIVEMAHGAEGGETVDDLIRRADQSMYTAKQSGRNRSVIFNPTPQKTKM